MYWMLSLVDYKRRYCLFCCCAWCGWLLVGVCVFAAFRERVSHAYGQLARKAELWCLTMIDPATGWFEIVEIRTK
jgi:hypothetical protein